MRLRLAATSGLFFTIIWSRIYPPSRLNAQTINNGVSRLRVRDITKVVASIQASTPTTTTTTKLATPSASSFSIQPECVLSSSSFSNSATTQQAKMPISYELLSKQNAETSNAIIDHYTNTSTVGTVLSYVACRTNQSAEFIKLANYEGNSTVSRDKEDGEKLQIGIDFAKEKGVIDPEYVPEPYVNLDVLGKTPDMVADEIVTNVQMKQSSSSKGSVIVLCGLSGTGKVCCSGE